MAKGVEAGEPAKLNYNELRYAHIDSKGAEYQVLTADPWAFVHRALTEQLRKKRGLNRQNLERAVYFAELAEQFYIAAGSSGVTTKGTLNYYFMLNLTKAYLACRGVELERKPEVHGLSLDVASKETVKVHGATSTAINVFAEFSRLLGRPIAGVSTVPFLEALNHIPELHSLYVSLGHAKKRKLLPIEYRFLVNATRDKLFVEVMYEKRNETKVDCSKFKKGVRGSYFREGFPREGWVVYRSKSRRSVNKNTMATAYSKFIRESMQFDVVSLLTRGGYRYYCDLDSGPLHHLSYALLAMFYVGAAARYRPLEIQGVLGGNLRPLVSELLSIAPKQFLYQVSSLITGKVCLVPFSDI